MIIGHRLDKVVFKTEHGQGSAIFVIMIAALEHLDTLHPHPLPNKMAAFGTAGGRDSGIKQLFITRPPLEEHIADHCTTSLGHTLRALPG